MKIAFWSNANEKCGVTENLAAISVASVTRYPYSVITLENRLSHNNLGKAFKGNIPYHFLEEVGTNYYDGGGMEGLMRKMYRGDYRPDLLQPYLKEILEHHLYYIPQSRTTHSEIFDYEFNHCIQPLFAIIEKYADICMIDTSSHNNLSTKTILDEADLIAVNLCQSQNILEDFFLNYSSLKSKAVFIINHYDFHSLFNCKRISKIYDVPIEDIVVLPQNEMYQSAYRNGNVVQFISRNYDCQKENPNYMFIQAIKKASFIMIKKAEQLVKQKEISLCGR